MLPFKLINVVNFSYADTFLILIHYSLCWHIIPMLTHYSLCWHIIPYVETLFFMLTHILEPKLPKCWVGDRRPSERLQCCEQHSADSRQQRSLPERVSNSNTELINIFNIHTHDICMMACCKTVCISFWSCWLFKQIYVIDTNYVCESDSILTTW